MHVRELDLKLKVLRSIELIKEYSKTLVLLC